MKHASKPVRYLLLAAWLILAFALGMRWLEGGSPGDMPEVLSAFVLLSLAFQWEGIARLVKQ
jgi:hypothetical protein